MTIQSPFPELKSFERSPYIPSLSEFLAAIPPQQPKQAATPGQRVFPSFPRKHELPNPHLPPPRAIKTPLPSPPEYSPFAGYQSKPTPLPSPAPASPPPIPSPMASSVAAAMEDELPPATDEELRQAFEPLIESSLEHVLYSPEKSLHTYLEPMLRNSIRRGIAEQMNGAAPFRDTAAIDRLGWRLKALVTSRSYEEVIFRATRRYQVEEVFLLRQADYSLLSFASHDPARHSSKRSVSGTVKKLIKRLIDKEGAFESQFDFGDEQTALVRMGQHTLLIALLRGASNSLVKADLDYALRQTEDLFGSRLEGESAPLLEVLQPLLEGCLLIQSPAPPN